MRSTVPPLAATWLLKSFGCSPDNETILGDLGERYALKQDPLWYWRQIALAIASGLVHEVRSCKFLTATGMLVGWGLLVLYSTLFQILVTELNLDMMFRVGYWAPGYPWASAGFFIFMSWAAWASVGAALSRLYWMRARTVVLAFAVSVVPAFLCFALVLFVTGRAGFNLRLGLGLLCNLIGLLSFLIGAGLLRERNSPESVHA